MHSRTSRIESSGGNALGLKEEIEKQVSNYVHSQYDISKSNVVPRRSHVTFGPSAKDMWAHVLYIDLRKSRRILADRNDLVSIRTHKSFIYSVSKCIRSEGGEPRSFGGDSVLSFFNGGEESANRAVRAAMKAKYAILKIVNPQLQKAFNRTIDFGIGVAQGEILVAKSGISGDEDYQDLIWIGWPVYHAVGYGETVSEPKSICISKNVYGSIKEDNDMTHSNGKPMWEKSTINLPNGSFTVYKTSYRWIVQ
jgi:hypothetical protein